MGILTDLSRSQANALYDPRFPKTVWPLYYHPLLAYGSRVPGANGGYVARVVWPETGTINAIAVFVVVSNGNLDVGVYNTAVTTRTRLASSGSTAVGTANNWQSVAISLAVTAGDQADLAFSTSSATASFAATAPVHPNMTRMPSGWLVSPLGGAPYLAAFVPTVFPLPATFTEAAMAVDGIPPFIMARYA